jgi:hypothetical protein
MSFSLDDIREAADRKYGSYDIDLPDGEVVKLRNVLRLSKAERKELAALEGKLSSKESEDDVDAVDEVDQQDIIEKQLVLIAHNKALGNKLIKELGGDFGMVLHVYTSWGKNSEMGEATASQS